MKGQSLYLCSHFFDSISFPFPLLTVHHQTSSSSGSSHPDYKHEGGSKVDQPESAPWLFAVTAFETLAFSFETLSQL